MKEGLGGSVSIFLRLSNAKDRIQFILNKNGFDRIPIKQPSLQYSGLIAAPVRYEIAQKNNVMIRYNPERYLLDAVGSLDDIITTIDDLIKAFENLGYDLEDMTRYLEFNTHLEEGIETTMASFFEKQVELGSLNKIGNLLKEEKLSVFQLHLSNSISPLHDNWLSFRINPDINSNKIVFIKVTKRTETFKAMIDFLTNFNTRFDEIVSILGEDGL
ncbi:hypothetical protein CEE45_10145 [Candidatus Heimdallarchaeota archaeon B3_Heim]|nr:MAG: hypothetical protein CEE45_10145 [Candidatus Heimdallarchaeota archaeon B3_Heim]